MFNDDVCRLIAGQTGRPESPFRVAFTGIVRKATWQIRGLQMACCRSNWGAVYEINEHDIPGYDAFVIVKRPDLAILSKLKQHSVPIIYDVIDAWAQPADGIATHNVGQARSLFKRKFDGIGPDSAIFANRQMEADLGTLVPHSTTIYHHSAPWLTVNPIRPEVKTIAYDGEHRWLGPWEQTINRVCDRFGWRFVVNPEQLADVDIVIAVRGGMHDNFLAQSYKSNVKLANAYASGTPCLMQREGIAYQETGINEVRFFSTDEELVAGLEVLRSWEIRSAISAAFIDEAKKYSITEIARQYEHYLAEVLA